MSESPSVSAIMPVYNGAPTLESAVESILSQSFSDWELIIVDDGSTDETPEILLTFSDPRIRIQTFECNRGRGAARNECLALARGKYIAVCDSDDISLPNRFETQVAFLDDHPEVGVVASQMLYFSEGKAPHLEVIYPENQQDISDRFRRGKAAAPNASSMIRGSIFEEYGNYIEECRRAQDTEFFLRIATSTRFHVLQEPLVLYRNDTVGLTLREWWSRLAYQHYAVYRARQWGVQVTPETFDDFSPQPAQKIQVFGIGTFKYLVMMVRRRLIAMRVS